MSIVAPQVTAEVVIDDDAQAMHAVKKGATIGTPLAFAITARIALIAGTTVGIAAAIGAWCGLFGGWYFGAIFFINSKPRTPRHPLSPSWNIPLGVWLDEVD